MSPTPIHCLAVSDVQANQIVGRLKAELFADHEMDVGAAVDGLTAGRDGRRRSEVKEDLCGSNVREGDIIISMHTEDVGNAARTENLFDQAWAHETDTADNDSMPKEQGVLERGPRPLEFTAA